MDSEKLLFTLYKKHQYEVTRYKIQGRVMLFSAFGMALGIILSIYLLYQLPSAYLYTGGLVSIIAAFVLQKTKVVTRNTASLIYFCYFCFVYTPVNWYYAGGTNGTTAFISIIIMLAAIIVFSRKMRSRMLIAYTVVLLAVTAYTNILTPAEYLPEMVYKSTAFIVAILLISYYILYMFKKQEQMHDQFLRGSIKDELTRVISRSALDVVINYVESQYRSKKTDYVMIMIDVDNFKKLNDEYGHVVGDIVLRNTAACIKEHMREDDFVIRYGGDEFLVVLVGMTIESASAVLDRIEQERQCKQLLDFHITVSRGYAKRSECASPEEVIKLADKRMYENKPAKC